MKGKSQFKVGGTIVIIGRPGAGKSPTVKELAIKSKMKNKIVYDPRREYDGNDFTIFRSAENFKNFITTCKGCFIICEEATGFINSFKDLNWTEFLIGIEHNRNILCFLFHSILDTPHYILRLSRGTILLQTNDDPELVKRSRPGFYKFLGIPKPYKPVYIDNYIK